MKHIVRLMLGILRCQSNLENELYHLFVDVPNHGKR